MGLFHQGSSCKCKYFKPLSIHSFDQLLTQISWSLAESMTFKRGLRPAGTQLPRGRSGSRKKVASEHFSQSMFSLVSLLSRTTTLQQLAMMSLIPSACLAARHCGIWTVRMRFRGANSSQWLQHHHSRKPTRACSKGTPPGTAHLPRAS